MFPLSVPPTFSVIAHRGASGYAPENTMAAFELARQMGAREMEFDCQLAHDGAVVICHDPSLGRFGYPDVTVAATPSGMLRRLDMGSWLSPYLHSSARMPLLEEVFGAFGGEITYHVELKSGEQELADTVFGTIREFGLEDNCVVISFRQELLARTRDLSEAVRLGWDVEMLDERTIGIARELDVWSLYPPMGAISAEAVEAAHGCAEEILVWDIEGTPSEVHEQIRRAVDTGCDGVLLNWPDRVVQSPV